jgi:hypothetical protein
MARKQLYKRHVWQEEVGLCDLPRFLASLEPAGWSVFRISDPAGNYEDRVHVISHTWVLEEK